MRKIIILQNHSTVPPGTIVDYFEENDIAYKVIKTYEEEKWPVLAETRGLIILGSPQSAIFYAQSDHLSKLFNYTLEAIRHRLPILGICFGSQLLAMAHGATVTKGREMELGNCQIELTEHGMEDNLFFKCNKEINVFHFHRDRWQLPDKAYLLATNSACPTQAFRSGNSVGLQFHPEVNLEIVKNWCEEFASSLEANNRTADDVISEYKAMAEELKQLNYEILKNFIKHSKSKEPGL